MFVLKLNIMRNIFNQLLRLNWPDKDIKNSHEISVIFVNYNTVDLTSFLLFTLFRVLGREKVFKIVVVDNGSTDGSIDLLEKFSDKGLIDLISNEKQAYHGPAINQAINFLAKVERRNYEVQTRYIWIVDSDILILRNNVLDDAIKFLEQQNAAAIGEFQYDALPEGYAHISSLLIDPYRCWNRSVYPFDNTGAPAANFQRSLRRKGLIVADFPFRSSHYLLHFGRGTLKSIYASNDEKNIYYDWATEHFDHHYHGEPKGREIHQSFLRFFKAEVPELTAEALLAACLRREPIDSISEDVFGLYK